MISLFRDMVRWCVGGWGDIWTSEWRRLMHLGWTSMCYICMNKTRAENGEKQQQKIKLNENENSFLAPVIMAPDVWSFFRLHPPFPPLSLTLLQFFLNLLFVFRSAHNGTTYKSSHSRHPNHSEWYNANVIDVIVCLCKQHNNYYASISLQTLSSAQAPATRPRPRLGWCNTVVLCRVAEQSNRVGASVNCYYCLLSC